MTCNIPSRRYTDIYGQEFFLDPARGQSGINTDYSSLERHSLGFGDTPEERRQLVQWLEANAIANYSPPRPPRKPRRKKVKSVPVVPIDHRSLKVGFEMTWVWERDERGHDAGSDFDLARTIAIQYARVAMVDFAREKVGVPIARFTGDWLQLLRSIEHTVGEDPSCIEVRTMPTDDLSMHVELYDLLTHRLRPHGFVPYRLGEGAQTGGLDTNVDYPPSGTQYLFMNKLIEFMNRHPSVTWMFAAPWDLLNCAVPVVGAWYNDYTACRDINSKDLTVNFQHDYIEFRAPMAVDNGAQVLAIADFHQRLVAHAHNTQSRTEIRGRDLKNTAASLQKYTLDSAWEDFCEVCDLLGVDCYDFTYHYQNHLVPRFEDYPVTHRM